MKATMVFMAIKKIPFLHPLRVFIFLLGLLLLSSCTDEGQVISRPDEVSRIFEASERVLLRAVARVMKDKGFSNPVIRHDIDAVDTDYVVDEAWRTKAAVRVRKLNDRETEAVLSVITEKKTDSGWEMRRLLEKKQYDAFFNAIELQIYREIYKAQ